MQTRLSRICDAVIEAGWLAVLVVTPLFFNTLTSRVFEPDKIHLLRSIVLVMAVAWAVQWLDGLGRRDASGPGLWYRIRHTPLVLPALLLTAAYILSTVLSIVPRISLLGSYVRGQGLYTFLCYRGPLLHGVDASPHARPVAPAFLCGDRRQPAHRVIRRHPALRVGPVALGRRYAGARRLTWAMPSSCRLISSWPFLLPLSDWSRARRTC